ncbi:hypothetical protein K491DRAFT_688335 [Lophiostoma macrostomum CBS 122681]|uniref:BYS1 domain protein n=1 Tax=Lophiostoma macrostomum CBS 122681 TaxID=1314788 RepID=A0A6A6TMX1_9PLEO|nr:hypothetical protein K491DRAFT_688335 [Lophiostoma macrostomum CBS 122681]
MRTTLFLPLVFPPFVSALGRAIVSNLCPDTLYLWNPLNTNIPTALHTDSSYSELYQSNITALLLTPFATHPGNTSQTVFSYALSSDKSQIWYNLSDAYGDPFFGRTISVKPSNVNCQDIEWYFGKPPAGSNDTAGQNCIGEADVEVEFCTGHCLPSWSLCGDMGPGICCTHCIGQHHCVAPPNGV